MTTAAAPQVITFRVGSDLFAADIFAVERVLRYAPPTAVPRLPDWVEGVLEYGGRMVPVIDLRARFGMERTPPRPEARIIVFAVDDEWVGALVDAVLEVVTLTAEQVSAPPKLFRGLRAEYLRGLVKKGDALFIFLEVTRLLTSTERLELTRALQGARSHG